MIHALEIRGAHRQSFSMEVAAVLSTQLLRRSFELFTPTDNDASGQTSMRKRADRISVDVHSRHTLQGEQS